MQTSNLGKQLTKLVSFFAFALFCSQGFAQQSSIDRIVIFGASLTDSGNAFVWLADPANSNCGTQQNVPPYDALDDMLIPDGPYAKGGHHFSNGATWAEGLARSLALAGNARPAIRKGGKKASNYAVGGARAVDFFPCRFNLPAQVDTYISDFGSATARTLVAIEIGGNDVRDALVAGLTRSGDPQQKIETALMNLYLSIYRLYSEAGARRFLVLNVPDIGKSPAVRAIDQSSGLPPGYISGIAGALSNAYNAGLAATVSQLEPLPDIDIRILDIHQTLEDVIAAPEDYGFSNVTDACVTPKQPPYKCEKPDEYIFWDGIHPTRALHAIVAQQAFVAITAP